MRLRGISVGRRLVGLVAVEGLCAAGLLALLLLWETSTTDSLAFMRSFVVTPFEGLAASLDHSAQLSAATDAELVPLSRVSNDLVSKLEGFARDYRAEWMVVGNPRPRATEFSDAVTAAGKSAVLAQEQEALANLERLTPVLRSSASIAEKREAVRGIRGALRSLLDANVVFLRVAQSQISSRTIELRNALFALGVLVAILIMGLGLRVNHAIAPRLRHLVNKVDRFREFGAFERDRAESTDEIALLGAALDTGFEAIAARDRDRSKFLAITAHELKTPLTSILGYSQAALSEQSSPEMRARALEVVRRHARRLGHLIDDLLMSAAARAGELAFKPTPLDLTEVARRTAREVESTVPGHPFDLHATESTRMLGDEALLSHSLWSLFNYAAAVSSRDQHVVVDVERDAIGCHVDVHIPALTVPQDDLDHAFSPFAMVQYEGPAGIRVASGLYFCRQVAHLHGGHVTVHHEADGRGTLTMELRS